jgi:hypothetical protein
LRQRGTRLADVARVVRGRVQVEPLRARDDRRQEIRRDLPAGLAAVGALVARAVGGVEHGFAAVDVVQRGHGRAHDGESQPGNQCRVGVGQERPVSQDPALRGRANPPTFDGDIDVACDQLVVDVVGVDVERHIDPIR